MDREQLQSTEVSPRLEKEWGAEKKKKVGSGRFSLSKREKTGDLTPRSFARRSYRALRAALTLSGAAGTLGLLTQP